MNNNQNTLGLLTFIVALATLILGLMGMFAPQDILTSADLDAALDGMEAPAVAPTAPQPTAQPQQPPAAPTTIDSGDLEEFMKTAYVSGNEDAKVTIIEFSDVECPFCARHTNNGTLDAVQEKYGDDVNVIFASFPLGFHPLAPDAGEAMECAGEEKGAEGFYAFKKALFAKGGKPTLDVIKTVAEEEGFDADALMSCVESNKYAQKVQDQMAFGRSIGVTGTPGNIVLNNETLEFVKVSGAVPASAFDASIGQYIQ